MTNRAFQISVTKFIEVKLDTDKFDEVFWSEFNQTISDRGGPDFDYLAEHVAWNFVQGEDHFIEGIGPLNEMSVRVREIDSEVDIISWDTP